jgi:hypothetical protein
MGSVHDASMLDGLMVGLGSGSDSLHPRLLHLRPEGLGRVRARGDAQARGCAPAAAGPAPGQCTALAHPTTECSSSAWAMFG